MPSLLELQSMMRAALCDGAVDDRLAGLMRDAADAEAILRIHRNTYRITLAQALSLSFPAVRKLVGDAFFDMAAHHLIERHPPANAWLDSYGVGFPDFLAGYRAAASLPYLAGVARLEVLVNRALHAADAPGCALAELAALDQASAARVRFAPHPSLGLLQCATPIDAIWSAVLAGDDAALAAIDPNGAPVWLLIARGPLGVEVARLDQAAWHFVAALAEGTPLAAAVAATADDFDVPGAMARHLDAGHFASYDIDAAA